MIEQLNHNVPVEISWIGSQIGDVLIEEMLGDGRFTWTYQGFNQKRVEKTIAKVAKPFEIVQNLGAPEVWQSQAFRLFKGGFSPVLADAAEVLELQCERMRQDSEQILARVEQFNSSEASSYLFSEFIEGVTLRELRGHYGPLSIDMALDLVRAVERLDAGQVRYHGDLSPDNIMISYSSVRLLDPGYFGTLGCIDGVYENCAVTTPAYYPFLTPNDLVALGIIFWELHFGSNPFAATASDTAGQAFNNDNVSDELKHLQRRYTAAGRCISDALLKFPRPRDVDPEINPHLEQFLLKAVGLTLNSNNQIDADDGFNSLAHMAEGISELGMQGLSEI